MKCFWIALVAAGAAGLGGCASATPPASRYFEIRPPVVAAFPGAAPAARLGLGRFAAPPELKQPRMVFRKSDYEIGFDPYARWTAPPNEMLTALLAGALRGAGVAADVEFEPGLRPNFILRCALERFEDEARMETPAGAKKPAAARYARLRLVAEVRESETQGVVASYAFDETRRAETATPDAVARVLSALFEKAVNELAAKVREALSTPRTPAE